MRDSVSKRFSAEKVTVIPNGVDTQGIQPSSEDCNYALYVGRLSPEKGIKTLLDAHKVVGGRVKLVVAGTGPLEQDSRRRYPEVEFLGHLSGAALADVFRRSSCVVVPSNCFDNCPMSVLEAMAFGKPVLGSDIGGIPELIVHGETGYLFPPNDHQMLATQLR